MRRVRSLYGGSPLHLLALLASFAIAGAAVVGWFQRPTEVANVLEWFVAAIVIHDLVLLPLYSLLDRIAFGRRRERPSRARPNSLPSLVNPTPYLRIPAILSGLLLLVFFPVIFGFGKETEVFASGIAEHGYLARWLLATGVMFALSGVAYTAAVARARVSLEPDASDPDETPPAAAASDADQAPPATDPSAPDQAGPDASDPDQTGPATDPSDADQTPPTTDQPALQPDQSPPAPDQRGWGDAGGVPPPAAD